MMNLTPNFTDYEKDLILKARKRFERYRYYEPNGAVEKFINLVGRGDTFVSFFSAANGVGKTTAGGNFLANLMFPCTNPYFKDFPLIKHFPYLRRGRIISDPTTIVKKIIPELKKWFPVGRYEAKKQRHDYEDTWLINGGVEKGGWEFDILSTEQDVKEFESVDLGWAWFDEPPKEGQYKATVSRMRRGGIIFITATPLMGSAWLYDDIYLNQEEGKREAVEADVEENCKEHGIRGLLRHENILKMISEYDEEDKQARVFGKFAHLVGLVYKKFSRDMHVIKPFPIKQEEYCVYEFLDPHPNNPDALMWVAVDRNRDFYIVDELYEKVGGSTRELAARIKQKAGNFRVVARFADPSAWNEDQHKNPGLNSLAKELAAEGLVYQPASKDRGNGIRLTRDALDYQKVVEGDQQILVKKPRLFVFDYCARTIWEFEHWIYQALSSKSAERHNPSDKPIDKDDHMMENLGRAFLANIEFVPYYPPNQSNSYESEEINLDPY